MTEWTTYDEYLQSPEWQDKRSERLRIDGFRCAKCHTTRGLQVHHLNYFRLGDEDVREDLITLCAHCHREITGIAQEERLAIMKKAEEYKEQAKRKQEQYEKEFAFAVNSFISTYGAMDLGSGGSMNLLNDRVMRPLFDKLCGVPAPYGSYSEAKQQLIQIRYDKIDTMLREHPEYSVTKIVEMTGFKRKMVETRKFIMQREREAQS